MNESNSPAGFVPVSANDFIGPARKLAEMLGRKAQAIKASGEPAKLLFYGGPGIGKTTLANSFAAQIAGHKAQIESVNGRNLTVERVRQWTVEGHYTQLYGGFAVKIVNELDTCNPVVQDALLSYLDEMKRNVAFVGTSNLRLDQLAERFQSRLQQFKLAAPSTEDIMGLLKTWALRDNVIAQLAVSCGGNVRACLLDAQSVLEMSA